MRKLMGIRALGLALALALGAGAAHAGDGPPPGGDPDDPNTPYTDVDCANAAAEGGGPTVTTWQGNDEAGRQDPLRGAICVSDGDASNGAELYVGGEIDTEASPTFTCGAIEVLGMQGVGADPETERTIFGDDDWGGYHCQ